MRPLHILMIIALCACGSAQEERPEVNVATPAIVRTTFTENGPQRVQTEEGTVLQGTMKDGKRVGIWRAFFPNGRMQSQMEYKDGIAHGPSLVYYANGSLKYTGDHEMGRAVGIWKFYDENGGLVREVDRNLVPDSTDNVPDGSPSIAAQ